jgi:Na+/H+ antiporter NhaC
MSEKIDIKNLTWQQVALCLILLASVMGAYKLFGEIPAGVLLVVSSVVNLLLGRSDSKGGKE